jgi:hypothetical protein
MLCALSVSMTFYSAVDVGLARGCSAVTAAAVGSNSPYILCIHDHPLHFKSLAS